MTRRTVDMIILALCAVIAVLLYSSTASFPKVSQGNTANYVRFIGLSMVILAVLQVYLSFKRNQKEKVELYTDAKRFFVYLLLLVGYIALISVLGFLLATALFLPGTMLLMGYRKKRIILFSSAGILLFLQVLFVTILRVPLPRGIIFG